MSLDDLIARLEQDADARVAAVEERAREEVGAIEAEAAGAAARLQDQILAKRRVARRARLDLELAQARQAAMRQRLIARYALVEKVLARARSLADGAEAEDAYAAVVAARLDAALRFVPARPVVVRCRPRLAKALRAVREVQPNETLEATEDAPVGIVVVSKDGLVEVDDSLRARLERLRPMIAIETVDEVDR